MFRRRFVGVLTEEDVVAVNRRVGFVDRDQTRVKTETAFAPLLRGGSRDDRQDESRTAVDIVIRSNEAVVAVRVFFVLHKAPPYSVMGHAAGYTGFLAVRGLVPLVGGVQLELDQGIVGEVIEPDNRVMDLAVLGFEADMSVVEGEGGVDDDYIVRHLSQVVRAFHFIVGLGIDSRSGVRVKE